MAISVESMSALQAEYAQDAAVDLAAMGQLLARLEQEPDDRKALREVMSGFHSFAGTGGTFGYPVLSTLGSEGELLALRVLAADAPLAAAERLELGSLIASLGRQLSEAPSGAEAAAGEAGARPRGTVLIAAAHEAVGEKLAPLLREEGFAVRLARSEAEALVEMRASLPDVLLSDAELPHGSGYRLVEVLRQLPNGEQPSVLVLGPRRGRCDNTAAIFSGADAELDRPADWADLARRLGQLHAGREKAGRVLAVEDDPRHVSFVRNVLEAEGYEVRSCSDPAQFAATLDDYRPHLVLMDVLLPGVSGYDLVRSLRGSAAHAGLPVLFLTTEGQVAARIESVRAGGDDHLVKPVSPPLLVSAVAARIERSRQLRQLLECDGLTRLLTQTAFLTRARAAAAAREPGRQRAWVMIDLDHFKSINDRFGHPTGDRVLKTVAAFLRRHVRARDVVGRYGGEEMALLFEDLPPRDVMRLVDRLRREFAEIELSPPDGGSFRVSFSAGVAFLRPGMGWEAWREAADQALYAAKAAGRNRVELAHQPADVLPLQPRRSRVAPRAIRPSAAAPRDRLVSAS